MSKVDNVATAFDVTPDTAGKLFNDDGYTFSDESNSEILFSR